MTTVADWDWESDGEDEEEVMNYRDRVCMVCNRWCQDDDDFVDNFKSCKSCPQSYHESCIPVYFRSRQQYDCNHIFKHDRKFKCCDRREPYLLTQVCSLLYGTEHYFYCGTDDGLSEEEEAIYYDPMNIQKARELKRNYRPKEIFARNKCRMIQYKGGKYSVGDTVKLRNDPDELYQANIAIIKEIYVCDEPDSQPTLEIFWYWREKELQKYIKDKDIGIRIMDISISENRRKYIDKHLYLDIDFAESHNPQNMVSIASVMNKVIVVDTFTEFLEFMDDEKRYDVYYGHYAYNSHDIHLPFEQIKQSEIRQTLIKSSKPKIKINTNKKVSNWMNVFNENYDINRPDDELKCMYDRDRKNENDDIRNNNNDNNPLQITTKHNKIASKYNKITTKRKTITKTKDTLADNEDNIPIKHQQEIKRICDKLGIKMNIGVKLYGKPFKSLQYLGYLPLYKKILDLIEKYDDNARDVFIHDSMTGYLRDIHAAIQAKGARGKCELMKLEICKKLKQLKTNYNSSKLNTQSLLLKDNHIDNVQNKKKRKRKELNANMNVQSTKKRKIGYDNICSISKMNLNKENNCDYM